MTRLQQAITVAIQALPNRDRQLGNAFWQGGLSGWATAPLCPPQFAGGDAGCRMSVINATFQGTPQTRQNFIDLLWRIHAAMPAGDPKGQFDGIIQDIASGAGSAEPWP